MVTEEQEEQFKDSEVVKKNVYLKGQFELGTLMQFTGSLLSRDACWQQWNDLVAPHEIWWEYLNWSLCQIMEPKPDRKWSAEVWPFLGLVHGKMENNKEDELKKKLQS